MEKWASEHRWMPHGVRNGGVKMERERNWREREKLERRERVGG